MTTSTLSYTHTLLIVDDNPTNLSLLSDHLREYGFRILVAQNSETALKRAQVAQPDLILLDVMMPGTDGFETCQLLKADPRTQEIPIIFLTALSDAEHKIKGFKVGGVDYITKPLHHEEVLARVTTHLRLRELTQNLRQQNQHLQRLTLQQELSHQVAEQTISILSLTNLLPTVVQQIQQKFGYYFVSVFLLNELRDHLVVEAFSGPADVLPLGFAIPLNTPSSIVVTVCLTGQPYLANDVHQDTNYLSNEGLPLTQAELVLVLRVGQEVIGVLDIQSTELNYFSQNDLLVLQALANQIAIAIFNARLYQKIHKLNEKLEHKVAERTAELKQAYSNLERLDQAKTDFIQVVSHELRTPITVIDGYTQLLRETPQLQEDEEAAGLIDNILRGNQRMIEIIGVVLDATKLGSDTLHIFKEPLALSYVVGQVRDKLEIALEERQLTLELEPKLKELPEVLGDSDLLFKALYHVVVNAVKYTPNGGRIIISGRVVEQNVELTIADTGIGIAPEHLTLIFEKFYQTGKANFHSSGKTSFKGGGLGLGLAIAQGIVVAHGGRVWAESSGYDEEKLPGSRFVIQLPID